MLKQLSKFFTTPARPRAAGFASKPDVPPRSRTLAPTVYCEPRRVAQCVGQSDATERSR
jgi:hypothetical protein